MSARVIYFSPVRWDTYAQRPHQMTRYLVDRCGAEVTWVEPYPTRLPRLNDSRRVRSRSVAARLPWASRVTVIDVPALPLEPLPGGAWLNRHLVWRRVRAALVRAAGAGHATIVIGKPSALALWAVRTLPHRTSVYDAMDDFPAFYEHWSHTMAARVELEIAEAVDRVLVCSPIVRAKFEARAVSSRLLPNGFDPRTLPASRRPPATPVLGFVGTMGNWFDWGVIARLARELAPWSIVLVGPMSSGRHDPLPSNVQWLGEHPHARAMDVMKTLSVGLLPFKDSPVARAMDPIKLYEYRALGLPVLATPVGAAAALRESDGVFLIRDDAPLRPLVERALKFTATSETLHRLRLENSWERRFDEANLGALLVPA